MDAPMTAEQWNAVWRLVGELEQHPQASWSAVAQATGAEALIVEQALAVLHASTSWNGAGARNTPGDAPISWTGRRLRQYRIGPPLGAGGSGTVYVATDEVLRRLVALKFVSSERFATPEIKQRILQEARAASALNHPNIVAVFEVVETEEATAMVMELVEGETLRQRCSRPQPEPDVVRTAVPLAQALAAAHARGLIHGDLKPENVMVREDGLLKLLDFGLARSANLPALPVAGTLRYLSPEQCRGNGAAPSSDIFAFGTLLYELSTGRNPFDKESLPAVLDAILHESPEPVRQWNPTISRKTEGLITAMLAKDPAARPDAATVVSRLTSAPGKRPARFAVFAGLLVSAVLVALLAIFARQTKPAPSLRQITTHVHENRINAAAISHDATALAYASVDKLWIRPLPNGQAEEIATPPAFQISDIAWYPDGQRLLISGSSAIDFRSSIHVVHRSGRLPEQLFERATRGALSPDGQRVAFLSEDRSEIRIGSTNGRDIRTLARTEGDLIGALFWSPRNALLYSREPSHGPDRLEKLDVDTGRTSTVYRNDDIATKGPMPMVWASYLEDGRILYLRYDSPDRYNIINLWELQTDPLNGEARSRPKKLTSFEAELGSLSLSRNGKIVSVVQTSGAEAVFVAGFDSSSRKLTNARRLTFDSSSTHPHAWTADSQSVIFESDRNGNFDLYRQNIHRQTPENLVVSPSHDFVPALTPDGGHVVYCAKSSAEAFNRIMRVPVDGGHAQEIGAAGPHEDIRCVWPGRAKPNTAPCVIRIKEPEQFRFVALSPEKGIGATLATVARPNYFIFGDWDLSPDGTLVAMPNRDPRSNAVRVIPLSPETGSAPEEQVEVIGRTNLHGLAWTADSKGWFLTINTTIGRQLLFCDRKGESVALGVRGWAVPAPDGRHVAYKDDISVGNVYFIENLQ